jgi:cell division protein FtsZ
MSDLDIRFELDNETDLTARMKVVGVGGAGGNAVNRMVGADVKGVDFIAINTDAQDLEASLASARVHIGTNLTKGLGAGANHEVGRQAILEDRDQVVESLRGSDLVFITCGMGGGTGTGAAPVVAEIAKEQDALTIGIVTKPFKFERRPRMRRAEEGIAELKKYVDTLIVIPNQRLFEIIDDKHTTIAQALQMADDVLLQATRGISDLIVVPGMINLDFADVRSVMREGGDALMGTGVASGEGRGLKAAEMAIQSPLLEDTNIDGAKGLLLNITAGDDLALGDIEAVTDVMSDAAGEECNVMFGAVIDPNMEDEIHVTLIATGLNNDTRAIIPPDLTARTTSPTQKPAEEQADPIADINRLPTDGIKVPDHDELNIPTFVRKHQR